MISKPQDLAIMFGLFALAIVTIGLGVADLNDEGVGVNSTFFDRIQGNVTSSTGLKGAAESSADSIQGEEGGSDETSQSSFIVEGFYSIIKLGKTWAIFQEGLYEIIDTLGINPIYLTIIVAMITISFAVVIYTWIRGD